MSKARKIGLSVMALLCVLTLGFALASCGSKETTPTYGYGEEGTYYYTASGDEDYMLNLWEGSFILDMGVGYTGTYECVDGTITFYEGEEETGSGAMTDSGISLTYGGKTYTFLRYEYYAVSFMDGGSTITTQSVLNGRAAQDPGDATKEGYVFLGWYEDSAFTERYGFNTSITSDTTVYAMFVEVTGVTEYKITYDFGNGETTEGETLNGKIYDLPEAEMSGKTFLGWWVSATNSADELTYRYDGETLYEDTTFFAFWVEEGSSYVGASVYDDRVTWENYSAAVTEIILRDESGTEMDRFSIQSTDQSYAYDFASLPAGKYILTIQGGGIDETLTYVSHALTRASGFTVISGSILMYSAVDNAERYYITIECGTEGHNHTMIDNGTSLYYDFSSCEMPAEGITFTVYAYAEGYYYSSSSYNYFLGLDRATVTVENGEVTWERVALAQEYEVYIDGTLVATTSDTSYSLSSYGTGIYEIAVRPVTTGYYSEKSETITFTKTTLASPSITNIEDYTVTWTPVEGATGYTVSINGTETTIDGGSVTSLILSDDNYTEGLDSYEISVKALAADSANDSPYGESITVTGTSVGSAVSYDNGTVTWQYSLSASEYRITVNDGDETIVTGTNSSPVTLTKSGNNEITIYFVNDYDEIYGTASVNVYAYAIVFDARGGTAYMDGEEVDTMYVAKGDTVTLPEADMGAITADFLGWYTLPDLTDDPDATTYQGDGVLFEDGAVFTGNSTIVLYACFLNPRLLVSLDPGMGTLADENGNLITETAISLNGRNYTVAVPDISDKAYVFYGWYSGENGTGTRYTDELGNAYAPFDDMNVTTLYAYWIQVFEITSARHNALSEEDNVFSVSKGSDIGLVSEVTIPESYTVDGVEYTQGIINGSAFSSCTNLKTINIPDTVIYIDISNNGYDSGTGVFASTALENVNVYATGEPSTTKEIIYYSADGVLFRINSNNGDVELLYYPYGRTDETYEIPETVSNENEYGFTGNGFAMAPVVREVNAIASSAFRGHAELVYMTIPEYITTIGSSAFYNCTSLTYVEFMAETEKIEDSMFYGCSSLTGFEISYTVKEIGDSVFRNCTSLTSIVIPDSVETLGTYLFSGCSGLTTAVISQNVTVVNNYDFQNCTSLKGVEIPYSVTELGMHAFEGCTSLVSVTIPDSVTEFGNYLFDGCSALESVRLSANITSIGSYGFRSCSSLKSIDIPEGVTAINTYAFYQCYKLESVTLPSTLESIGSYAFRYCYSLTQITIPTPVTSIGSSAFRDCYKLVEVYDMSEGNISSKTNSNNGYLKDNALNVYTPEEGESKLYDTEDGFRFYTDGDERYLLAYYGDEKEITLPASVDGGTYEIYKYVFYQDADITSVTMTAGVTAIGTYAFYQCVGLRHVTLCEPLATIGTYVFSGCSSLVSVTIPSTVTSIGTQAFYNCYKLVEVCNLSSLTITAGSNGYGYVGNYAKNVYTSEEGSSHVIDVDGFMFVYDGDGVYYLYDYEGDETELVLPDNINGVGYEIFNYAFYGNDSITSVTIPGCVTAIGNYAFRECYGLETVYFDAVSCADLASGNQAFGYAGQNSGGVTVYVGADVERIPAYLFYTGNTGTVPPVRGVIFAEGSVCEEIGAYAFEYCTSLESINVPDTLEIIGDYAFYGCSSLKAVDIPDPVTRIGGSAFFNCSSLRDITVGGNVTEIGRYAFGGTAYYDRSSNWKDGVLYLGNYIIIAESSLSGDFVVPDGIMTIADYAFNGCSSITSVTFPDSVMYVGQYAFYNCSSVETVRLSENMTDLSDYCFYQCKAIVTLTIPDSVGSIGDRCFYGCTSLESVSIGNGVRTIGDYAFRGCSALTAVVIPDGVESIGGEAFQNCTHLESVTFGAGLVTIGTYAFDNCTLLDGVVIPDSVRTIEERAFNGCSALTSIDLGNGVKELGNSAFRSCTSLVFVTVPDSVETMGTYVFYGCTSLGTIYMGTGLTEVRNYSFQNCSALTEIDISDIGAWAAIDFGGTYANPMYYGAGLYLNGELVKDIVIPEGTEKIGSYAFYQYDYAESLSVAGSVKSIGTYAFYNCTNLAAVTFDEGLETIDTYAFSGCTGIESLVFPGSVISIGSHAFFNDTGIETVVFSEGLETIDIYAFSGCEGIKSVVLPDSLISIGNYAFQSCTSLASVTICEGVESIGNYAFAACPELVGIVIPDSVTSMGTYVFYNCTSLEWIVIGSGVESIGNYAFSGCSKLSVVYYNGDEDGWKAMSIGSSSNSYFTNADRYYYSETEPAEDGNWWHWVDGEVVIWRKD